MPSDAGNAGAHPKPDLGSSACSSERLKDLADGAASPHNEPHGATAPSQCGMLPAPHALPRQAANNAGTSPIDRRGPSIKDFAHYRKFAHFRPRYDAIAR
jgi:hypothetical protein